MAEQLGEAVLKLSVDSAALDAGLQRAQQQFQATAQASQQAFGGQQTNGAVNSIQALESRLQGLRQAYNSVEIGSQEFRKLQAEIRRTERELATAGERLPGIGQGLRSALGGLAGLAGIVGIGALTQQIISAGQESQRSKIQLEALAGAYGEAGAAAQSVQRIQSVLGVSAQDARQGFAQLYASLRGTGIGLQQLEVLFVGVSNAARLSGASTAEAQGALLQLRQGLASGRLQGDELRSVLENLPALSQAIAKELGVNVGQIKQLGADGKITSDIIFNAAKSLADATTPGRTSVEQLGIAYTNLKEKAAEAFGPALLTTINNVAAGIAAFAEYLRTNREALTAFGQSVVGIARTLAPLAVGVLTVQAAFKAWAIAVQAVRIAQAGLLALQGPAGWAVVAGGIAATALAAKKLEDAYRGVEASVGKSRQEADKALAAFKALSGQTALEPAKVDPTQATLTSVQTVDATSELELRNIRDKIDAARELNRLDDVGRQKLENRLALSEKLRANDQLRLQLQRELDKPRGAGDGQNGTQSLTKVAELQNQIQRGEAETTLLRLEQERTEAQALRTQQERFRVNRLDAVNAADKLRVTQQLTTLEAQAALRQTQVSETAKLQLQQQLALTEKLNQREAARAALQTELSKPKAQQDRVVVGELQDRIRRANQDVVQAYADAGLSLVQNARSAADALKGAQKGLQDTLRGGFDVLTPGLQQEQLARARAAVQPLVDRGVIRQGIDISSPDKLFRLASFAESFSTAESAYAKALAENTAAQEALKLKEWTVNVNVPGGTATGDVVGAINGGL